MPLNLSFTVRLLGRTAACSVLGRLQRQTPSHYSTIRTTSMVHTMPPFARQYRLYLNTGVGCLY
jgi:hypothetical protein